MNDSVVRLVEMINDVSSGFDAAPEDEAVRSIAEHLLRFWHPRMRQKLIAHWQAGGGGLHARPLLAMPALAEKTAALAP